MSQPAESLEEYIKQNEGRVQVYMRGPKVTDKEGKNRLAKEIADGVNLYCRLIYESAQAKQLRAKHAIPDNWIAWKQALDRVLSARNCAAAAILPGVDKVFYRWLERLDKKEYPLQFKVRDYEGDYGEIDWKSKGIDK